MHRFFPPLFFIITNFKYILQGPIQLPKAPTPPNQEVQWKQMQQMQRQQDQQHQQKIQEQRAQGNNNY